MGWRALEISRNVAGPMISGSAPAFEIDAVCAACGQYGAYGFDSEELCVSCYQERGSSCAGPECDLPEPSSAAVVPSRACDAPDATAVAGAPPPRSEETHRVNPNCCYSACPRCSSMRRLREFQARHPVDWRSRLRGLPRLIRVAQARD